MRIRITATCIGDLQDGKRFYDRQEQGVGDYFQDCLFSEIDSLVLYAGIHRKIFGFHRLLSKRFPYAIYYRIDGDCVIVYRVLDCRCDPRATRRALGWFRLGSQE